MKMFKFHFPVVGFGEDVDEALESAWERFLEQPNESVLGKEIEYMELDTEEHAVSELNNTLTPIGSSAGRA
jgi:hypothetical protein